MIALVRRVRGLVATEITTAPAPVLGGPHVDIDDAAPAGSFRDIATSCPVSLIEEDLAAGDEPLELVDHAPAIDRGTCYHDLHFEHDGRRFGALIHPHQHSASLLPCPYLGRAGR